MKWLNWLELMWVKKQTIVTMFSVTLKYKVKGNNILVPNLNQADFEGIRHKLA